MDLNEAQKQAVIHNTGPMMVLAGPGSGKTFVITERIKHLIHTHRIQPDHILVVTFTKAAAAEMKNRYVKQMEESAVPVNFGTFHSIFFAILRHAYHYNASNILREDHKMRFFNEIIETLEIEIEDEKEFIHEIESEISFVKSEQIEPENYYSMNCPEESFRKIFYSYAEFLRKHRWIDFDDMMIYCKELFEQREDVLKMWQKRFQYILIDEFQDINKLQYQIIRMLAEPENNLFIVGDDDQSIYRFRGAKPELMLDFQKDYPNAKKVLLNINYRCSANILEGASRIIQFNNKRFQKEIKAYHSKTEPIRICHFRTLRAENEAVVTSILEYYKKEIPYSNMAVLFRTNNQPRALVGKLMEYNIPFRMKDTILNIFDHWIAQDMIAYIKLAQGNRDRKLVLKIINRPNRFISREALDTTPVDFNTLLMYYEEKKWMINRIEQLNFDLHMLQTMNPYAAINYIRKGIGYNEFLKEYAQWRKMSENELTDILDEIQESTKEYKTLEQWVEYTDNYGEQLKEQKKENIRNQEDAIALMTMHSSKGLEFQVVFILDANEGITPYQKAIKPEDMEEERRMFYVAVTRAKEYLHIYSVKERYNKELLVSRFVEEMKQQNN